MACFCKDYNILSSIVRARSTCYQMVGFHQAKHICCSGTAYAKFLLDFPLGNGCPTCAIEKAEDMGLHRCYGIIALFPYSLFKFTGNEV